tara:strand:- start:43 stop:1011 length:969 start_codon:yes stop_codon:yes gene_type:complete
MYPIFCIKKNNSKPSEIPKPIVEQTPVSTPSITKRKRESPIPTNKNKGETAEVKIKQILKFETEKNNSITLQALFGVDASHHFTFPDQSMLKASSKSKSDCSLIQEQNGKEEEFKISIKYFGGNSPSIVNQERRSKPMYSGSSDVQTSNGLELNHLDVLIQELNYERSISLRKEEIQFNDITMTDDQRNEMEKLLVYHTFIGAGCGPFHENTQANAILEVYDLHDMSTWHFTRCISDFEKKEYIRTKWNKYSYSIRPKGMASEKVYMHNNSRVEKIDAVWAIPLYINRLLRTGSVYPFPGCEELPRPWFQKPRCTLNIRLKK